MTSLPGRTTAFDTSEPAAGPPASSRLAAQLIDATKTYRTGSSVVRALDGVTLEFAAGAFTAIMGPSGSGKSTLLHCLAGLDTLDRGEVIVGGVALSTMADRQLTMLRRDRLGFVFQAFNLVPTLTARENILLPLSLAGTRPEPQWFDTIVDTVGLGDRLDHRPSELSGGQQQRVAVARALVTRPDVVLADEPTGNLDSASGNEILAFLRRAVEALGQTVVIVTHDPAAAAWSDEAVFLLDGRVQDRMVQPTATRVLDHLKTLEY